LNLINVEAVEAMFIDDWQVGSRRSTNQPLSRAPLGRLGELGRCGPRRNSKSGRLQSKTADGKVIVGGGGHECRKRVERRRMVKKQSSGRQSSERRMRSLYSVCCLGGHVTTGPEVNSQQIFELAGKENNFLQRAYFSLTPRRRFYQHPPANAGECKVSGGKSKVSRQVGLPRSLRAPRWVPKLTFLDSQTGLPRFPNWPPSIVGGLSLGRVY
jgi:hypothetical protein